MSRAALAAFALIALPLAHAAESPAGQTIGFIDTASPHCFAATYDAAHLAAHPAQKVTALALSHVPGDLITTTEGRVMFAYNIAATLKDVKPTLANSGVCYAGETADQLNCESEGDGGIFTLTRQADGTVRLDNPAALTVINDEAADTDPDAEFVHIDAKDDQASFLLTAGAEGLCAPAQ